MTDLGFVDTNILVYSKDAAEPEKARRAQDWLRTPWEDRTGRTSVQVLNEFYNTLRRKFAARITVAEARAAVSSFKAWTPRALDLDVAERVWQLQDRFSLSWWDALIVAAAQLEGCSYLLTEDLQTGQDFDGLIVINPFAMEPAALLPR